MSETIAHDLEDFRPAEFAEKIKEVVRDGASGPVRKKPMISLSAATGLLDAIEAAGGNADRILDSLGLERSLFSYPEGFISCAVFDQLLQEAARATGDDRFGLHFGEHFNPKDLGALAYVLLNSPTIKVGFENVGRYLKVHNEAAKVSVAVEGERVYLRYRLIDTPIEAARQHNEYGVALALNAIRMMLGSQWVPLEIQFAHEAPDQISEHLRVFGAPVLFGYETNAFVVEREVAERPVPAADQRLYRILKRYLDHVLDEMPREDELLASVRRAIAETMRDGRPKLARVAKKGAMSPRTLQRRLKEYGVDFNELVDDTRRRFSLNYLRDCRHTLTEVAFLLGYSELSAFNRAFKRWTGSTPLEYRRRITENQGADGLVLYPPPEEQKSSAMS